VAAVRRCRTGDCFDSPDGHLPRLDTCGAEAGRYVCRLHRTLQAYVQYDAYLDAGLPIATGVIEGACRHVIRDRMEITGARWSLEGAEAVLRLRSLRASGDLDKYWRHHEQRELERNHAARYANGKIPRLTRSIRPSHRKPKPPRLHVVKS
jgi:hypothetical protein